VRWIGFEISSYEGSKKQGKSIFWLKTSISGILGGKSSESREEKYAYKRDAYFL
jgi:hypothetical protein